MFLFYKVIFQNAKKEEDLFLEELARSVTVQGLVTEGPEDTNAKCKLYKKVFKLLNLAADALKSHADRERNK